MTSTTSDDSDEPEHLPSLNRVFAVRMKNQYGPPVWRKSEIGDAESGADIKIHEQY